LVKLTVKEQYRSLSSDAFYFRNMKDCQIFLGVFKNHWCNVPWDEPVEIPKNTEIDRLDRVLMSMDPAERADSNLSWGFNLAKRCNTDKITPRQQRGLHSITKLFSKHHS
jgi:hypothetical protein